MKRVTQDGPLGDKLMLRDREAGVLAITGGTVSPPPARRRSRRAPS